MKETIKSNGYKKLNFTSLKFTKEIPNHVVNEHISPIDWSEDVLNGKKQVLIKK